MSAEVYARGVWLTGDTIILKDGDLTVQLRHAPRVHGVAELDFGEVDMGTSAYPPEIRPVDGDRRREMEAPEIQALKERIAIIHNAVVAVLQSLKGIASST